METSILSFPTLVLNKSWIVVNVTTVKRAIGIIYEGNGKIVCPDTFKTYSFDEWKKLEIKKGEKYIKTVNFNFKLPEVIQLTKYNDIPPITLPFTRENLYKRDNYTCQYCGKKLKEKEITIDHIIPKCRGGKSSWTNCVIACLECNKKKGNKTLKESKMKLIREPYKPTGYSMLFYNIKIKPKWKKFILNL